MNRKAALFRASVLLSLAATTVAQDRSDGLRHEPDSLFDTPVDQIFSILAGADRDGVAGRVGREFVFWGYRLSDQAQVMLFACAPVDGVDCNARAAAVCPAGGGEVVARSTVEGKVRELDCSPVTFVAPGTNHPGCTERLVVNTLEAGLLACV